MKMIKVYINEKVDKETKEAKRKIVEAKLIEQRTSGAIVELEDGNQIYRKNKDIVTNDTV